LAFSMLLQPPFVEFSMFWNSHRHFDSFEISFIRSNASLIMNKDMIFTKLRERCFLTHKINRWILFVATRISYLMK
jgi:hypothetical protein